MEAFFQKGLAAALEGGGGRGYEEKKEVQEKEVEVRGREIAIKIESVGGTLSVEDYYEMMLHQQSR